MACMLEQLVAFAATSLVVIVVPGPDMMLTLRNAARSGRAGALWTAAGIMTGLAILGTAAALGITALLTASPTLFQIVRIAGGVYLVYLGVQALRAYVRARSEHRTPGVSAAAAAIARPRPGGIARSACFRQGLLSNLLNPKVAAFYLSLFPQFDLSPLTPLAQHIALAATFWLLCLAWYAALITVITRLAPRLQSPAFARRTEGLAGTAMTGLGALVLTGSA